MNPEGQELYPCKVMISVSGVNDVRLPLYPKPSWLNIGCGTDGGADVGVTGVGVAGVGVAGVGVTGVGVASGVTTPYQRNPVRSAAAILVPSGVITHDSSNPWLLAGIDVLANVVPESLDVYIFIDPNICSQAIHLVPSGVIEIEYPGPRWFVQVVPPLVENTIALAFPPISPTAILVPSDEIAAEIKFLVPSPLLGVMNCVSVLPGL